MAAEPADASALPIRERGTRSRAGNAMNRTRAAVLDGAARAVASYGARRATMGDIAGMAGIAKATIYNHFRAKEDVYRAAVEAGVAELVADCTRCAGQDLAGALRRAADRLAEDPALLRLAAEEPELAARFAFPGPAPAWQQARNGVRQVLTVAGRDAGPDGVELVLRWVASHAGAPGSAAGRARQAALLAAALPADLPEDAAGTLG